MTASTTQVNHVFCMPLMIPFHTLFLWWFESTNTCMQERYRSVRWRIWGIRSIGMDVDDSIAVELEELFDAVLRAFPYVKSRFGRRKSSPGYNFVFRRLLDLLGHTSLGVDFPPLKSRKKRSDAVRLWRAFCAHLNWPYVNSDGKLFGAAYTVGVEEFDRGRRGTLITDSECVQQLRTDISAPSGHDARGTQDTESCSDRLRRECDECEGAQFTWWEDIPPVPEFLFARDSFTTDGDSWPSDGDNYRLWEPCV